MVVFATAVPLAKVGLLALMLPASVAAAAGWAVVLVWGRRAVAANLRLECQPLHYTGSLASMVRLQSNARCSRSRPFVPPWCCRAARAPPNASARSSASCSAPSASTSGCATACAARATGATPSTWWVRSAPTCALAFCSGCSGASPRGYLWGDYAVRKRRYLFAQLRWAGHAGRYEGDGAEARRLYVRGGALCCATLGFYVPWHLVALRNDHLSRVSLVGVRLVCTQDGPSYLAVCRIVWPSTALSLGLASGWARAHFLPYQVEHVALLGELQAPMLHALGPALDDGVGPSQLLSGALLFEA